MLGMARRTYPYNQAVCVSMRAPKRVVLLGALQALIPRSEKQPNETFASLGGRPPILVFL